MQTQTEHPARSRAAFQYPKNIDARIKAEKKARGYRVCKAPTIAYGVGCKDGEEAASAFYRDLMEKHPDGYGGRLASLLIDAAGLELDGTVETSYRRGWIVGIAFVLECWFYEDACRWHGG